MLSLVRSGPTVIKLYATERSKNLAETIRRISSVKTSSPMESYSNASEGDTLIFLFVEGTEAPQTYQTTLPATTVLGNIIKEKLCGEVTGLRITPPNIIMRLMGDLDAAIDQIAKDFQAVEAECNDSTAYLDQEAVLLNFTEAPLNRIVQFDEFYRRALLIDKPYGRLLVYLRAKAQEYLNIAMGSPDWNEVPITIFDAADQFNLHYQRLITVLQALDLGIVAGESWEPEYTVALRKSEVYQIRLLTPFDATEIKRICLGLEYDDTGTRVVDFDVYAGKRKVGWATERKNFPDMTRAGIGLVYRKQLIPRVPSEARAFLANLDRQIEGQGLKGRK